MKRQDAKSGYGRWWFLATVAALYTVCAALAPELALRALAHAWQALRHMLPVLALVFVLMVVFDLVLNPRRLAQQLGRPGGARGWLLALAAGILSAGPIYAWYPLLAELRGKGMRVSTAAVFLYARAIKLPLLPLLFHYFGTAYSVVLSLYLAGFALLSGLVMERISRSTESAD
ncbi:MAG: hypothetical protein A2150_02285 [Candidatus Muproteobacteria bacterium RBG_16_64_11]|uniref:Permease n=1 Tax=Candidatus Muproteobacteria bacterium RBG_16_64_11 TaxID=1817758 RepID=A0A1F6TFW3_9PROT|nr:MAG: hypothetical protein A2150_02285 [Candidatus Muproteobacteria bacterium RBG_16_64_11]